MIATQRVEAPTFPICKVSYTDHLFLRDALMMVVEMSTTSLFQVL